MFLSKNRMVLAKVESVFGQDPNPTVSANAMEVKAVKINRNADALDREIMRSSLSSVSPVTGRKWLEVSFTAELKGSGHKGVAPRVGALLQACGFSEHIDAGSSVLYAPTSSTILSCTLYIYDLDLDGGNARLTKVTGCRGNVSLKGDAGKYSAIDFKMMGNYVAMEDVAAPGAPTFEGTLPPIVENCGFKLNNNDDLVVSSISIDMNNDLVPRENIAADNGIDGFIITGRKASGQFNPEAVLKASYDFLADWEAATERAMELTVGSVDGNKVEIKAPKVTIVSLADSDKSGVLTQDIPFRLSGSDAGDDELTLAFK